MDKIKTWFGVVNTANSIVGSSIQDLPDEVIVLIFCKLDNPWYHACRLSHLCRKFNRVKDDWSYGLLAEVCLPDVHQHEFSALQNLIKSSPPDCCLPARAMKLGISSRSRRFLTKLPPPLNMANLLSRFPSLINLDLLGMQHYINLETVQIIITDLPKMKWLSLSCFSSVADDPAFWGPIYSQLLPRLHYFHQHVVPVSGSDRMTYRTIRNNGKDFSLLAEDAESDAIPSTRIPIYWRHNSIPR